MDNDYVMNLETHLAEPEEQEPEQDVPPPRRLRPSAAGAPGSLCGAFGGARRAAHAAPVQHHLERLRARVTPPRPCAAPRISS